MRILLTFAALLAACGFGYLSFCTWAAAQPPGAPATERNTKLAAYERIHAHCERVIRDVEEGKSILLPFALDAGDELFSLEEFAKKSPEERANMKASELRLPVSVALVRQRLAAAKATPESIDAFVRDSVRQSQGFLKIWRDRRDAMEKLIAKVGGPEPGDAVDPIKPEVKKPEEKDPDGGKGVDPIKPDEKKPEEKKPDDRPFEEKKPDDRKGEEKKGEEKPSPFTREDVRRMTAMFVGKWRIVKRTVGKDEEKIGPREGVRFTMEGGKLFATTGKSYDDEGPGLPCAVRVDASPQEIDLPLPAGERIAPAIYYFEKDGTLHIGLNEERAGLVRRRPTSFEPRLGFSVIVLERVNLSRDEAADPLAEAKRFVGSWKVVSALVDGKEQGDFEKSEGPTFVLKDGALMSFRRSQPNEEKEYWKIDPAISPKQADIETKESRSIPVIYQFNGRRLQMAIPKPDKDQRRIRPTEFRSSPTVMVMTLEPIDVAKPDDPATRPPIGPKVETAADDLTIFVYSDGINAKPGTIEQLNKTTWIETTPKGTIFRYREVDRTKDYVELQDAGREVSLRVYASKVMLRHPTLTDGEWQDWRKAKDEKAPPGTFPLEKKTDRTLDSEKRPPEEKREDQKKEEPKGPA